MVLYLKNSLINFDKNIGKIETKYGPEREGDISHSLASIDKAISLLNYKPTHSIKEGIIESIEWYINNLKLND